MYVKFWVISQYYVIFWFKLFLLWRLGIISGHSCVLWMCPQSFFGLFCFCLYVLFIAHLLPYSYYRMLQGGLVVFFCLSLRLPLENSIWKGESCQVCSLLLGYRVTWTEKVDEQLLTVPGDWSSEELVSRIHNA